MQHWKEKFIIWLVKKCKRRYEFKINLLGRLCELFRDICCYSLIGLTCTLWDVFNYSWLWFQFRNYRVLLHFSLHALLSFQKKEKGAVEKELVGKGCCCHYPVRKLQQKHELGLQEWVAQDYFLLNVCKIIITLVYFLQVNEAEIPNNSYTENYCMPLKMLCYLQLCCCCISGLFDLYFLLHCKASYLDFTSQKNQQKAFRFNLKHFSFWVSSVKSSDLIFSSLQTLHNLKGKELSGHRTTSINLQNPVSRAVSSVVNLELCTGEWSSLP